MMETTALFVVLSFAAIIYFAIRQGNATRTRYRESLERLKLDPTNPELREESLRLGRKLIPHTGKPEFDNLFTEVSLMNDINAACARTAIPIPQATTAEQLAVLSNLVRDGLLSPEEFDKTKKQAILMSRSDVDEAAKLLRQLHALFKEGVLSESEFNMKKWDILARRIGSPV